MVNHPPDEGMDAVDVGVEVYSNPVSLACIIAATSKSIYFHSKTLTYI